MMITKNILSKVQLDTIEEAIEDIKNGKVVIRERVNLEW